MELLNIKNLSKENKNLNIIADMNLTINKGETIGIKCSEEICLTIFKLIFGKIQPSKGSVTQSDETRINLVLKDDGLYERLTVNEYLKFFRDISNYKSPIEEIKIKLGLVTLKNTKIKNLSHSEKGRLRIARALVSNSNLILIQEPTLYHDMESSLIVREALPYINSLGIALLCTSVSLEEILLLDCTGYILDKNGFNAIEIDTNCNRDDEPNKPIISEPHMLKITKIPAKINEKTILFNPTEITYMESLNGTTYINVGEEKFPCTMSLTELENKLKDFGFFRCHRSYLVNLQKVREVINWTRNSFSLTLDGKDKKSIPLSKSRIDDIKKLLYI
ncbi:LytTR family transcriptional regulator DNA-binding domain-containing protein [Clostridium sp.]|jgi:ABC-2 type transport system ATP-binding protein|uniref:LytTR family transcriptional regulator DNA-binding domain-containing protein n=1 Tax=Clostridium sp. TaxID=1506 RepID=UPI002585D12D|nr:LytTR family transcriptional regulator DNA-binding domain-containing protein [Clostridium sp.]MDF2505614.1 transporter [Clostridium sp.]